LCPDNRRKHEHQGFSVLGARHITIPDPACKKILLNQVPPDGAETLFLHRFLHRADQLLEGEGLGQERELFAIVVRRQALGESLLA